MPVKKMPKNTYSANFQPAFTTRLQKGGALLSDMRSLVAVWSDEVDLLNPLPTAIEALSKATVPRAKDIYVRAFNPRFINGSPPNAWKLARALEDCKADIELIRPFYYWITARVERPLYDFVTDVLYSTSRSASLEVRIDEVAAWIGRKVANESKKWTPTVTRKVARGILAALRDFGILHGKARKYIAPFNFPVQVCALISFCLQESGLSGLNIVKHLDWRLFLLGEIGIEHLLLECHQHGWLGFETAGNIYRIDFPKVDFQEYVRAVIG